MANYPANNAPSRSFLRLLIACSVFLPALLAFCSLPLLAYQWPLPARQIIQGFLAGRPADRLIEENPLPNLGVWFEVEGGEPEQAEVVRPYHTGEIIYFETSSDMKMLGAIPRNISHTIVVEHEKLLFRYSSDNLQVGLQDRYQLQNNDLLFRFAPTSEGEAGAKMAAGRSPVQNTKAQLYMEVFDTQFQTVINPKLIMPSSAAGDQSSRPYLESITVNANSTNKLPSAQSQSEPPSQVRRPLRKSDQLSRGLYNLSFLFPQNQGPPLQLDVSIDGKKLYSELFDQIYGVNSKLIINDRDLQDIYIADELAGKFFLGTINLQDKVNSSIDILVDEEHIDGSHNMNNYNVRIR